MKRQYFLKNKGWKLIRIISKRDLLPPDYIIINLYNEIFSKLKTNKHSWYKINIDENLIECSNEIVKFNFNELRKI